MFLTWGESKSRRWQAEPQCKKGGGDRQVYGRGRSDLAASGAVRVQDWMDGLLVQAGTVKSQPFGEGVGQ